MSFLWEKIARPAMFTLDAERAHELGIKAMKMGLASPYYVDDPSFGIPPIELFGLKFANPLGVAAGFDKNGVVVDQLASLGFSFVEVGTVTLRPQPGNPKPRLFRLPEDKALINRLGFNNDGAPAVAERLSKVERKCVVGVNIGRNKDVPNGEAVENYVACFEIMHPVADYIAVNISSPNTPNLRDLQRAESLEPLLSALTAKNDEMGRKPLLVKIAPDLSEADVEAAVDVCTRLGIDGMIATNTTISREALDSDLSKVGDGGLSGKPLFDRSNEVIATIYRYSKGHMPIIGVGGIFTVEDAVAKIGAGASLVQAYTGFVYGGPTFAADVNRGLRQLKLSQAREGPWPRSAKWSSK
jgi:dihydroorotate dehydrogenase